MAMSPSQARVVDPILSNVARGYTNSELIGNIVCPVVPVNQRGGRIIVFNKEHFRIVTAGRAPGAQIPQKNFEYSDEKYAISQDAVAAKVTREEMEEAAAVPGLNLQVMAVNQTLEQIRLTREYKQASVVRDASRYSAENKLTLTGSSKWSDGSSSPAQQIRTGREAVRTKIGRYPKLLTLSATAFAALQEHPAILERFKYTSKEVITEEMLAKLFQFEKVLVGAATYLDASGNMQDVWGDDVIMSYSSIGNLPTLGAPTAFCTYQLKGYPMVEQGYFDKGIQSWLYNVYDEAEPVASGVDAAYILKDVV